MTARIENVSGRAFDYVIVGGGTAGLTLASRLSENSAISVLVLESGGENLNDPDILRPASYGTHFTQDKYIWPFKTTKQQYANDAQPFWPRGKGLGGSSSINFMCYTKPPAEDIDDIERLGNPGWNWKHYNRLLQKTEGFIPPTDENLAKAQLKAGLWDIGSKGPLTIAFPATISNIEAKVQETMSNAGLPPAPDPHGGNPSGYFIAPNTLNPADHTRAYSVSAFYLPNKHRSNLTVLASANVERIITEAVGGIVVAKGVEFAYGGENHTVNATKEVVLCAGTLKSPQILELSGIGSKEILDRINVPLKVDLPGVGNNVQEHLFIGFSFELKDNVSVDTLDLLRDPEIAAKHVQLHKAGSGIYTQGIIGFAFASLDMFSPKASEVFSAAKETYEKKSQTSTPGLKDQYSIHLARLERGAPNCEYISFPGLLTFKNPPVPGKRYLSILAGLNHGWSRGTIHAVSSNPSDEPEFDPHDFEEDIDMQMMVESLHFIRKLSKTAPLKDLIVTELNPGAEVTSDAQMEEYIKKFYSTTYHTAGSCSMLPKEKGGVVDPDLKVYGTDNIRVVDLSVLPIHIASHTQSTVYAIAEHAAEVINGIMA